jgi:hypothetical protein
MGDLSPVGQLLWLVGADLPAGSHIREVCNIELFDVFQYFLCRRAIEEGFLNVALTGAGSVSQT